jgi:DNA repair exonuclease SbcCD nuclease subunit
MKVALITDTHYNFKKANKAFHDYFLEFYSNIFFPYLEENNIKTVVHLGDAFDNRRGIDYWAFEWAKKNVYDRFKELGITVYNIVGNHDAYYKNTNEINSIDTLLDVYDNVIKINTPKTFHIDGVEAAFLPWICQENQEETFKLLNETTADIVFGHLELSGFSVYPGHVHESGMDKKIFNKFKLVFSGHYHTRSNDGKIFYLGNPYQMFWNDFDDKRGFNIFDTETFELNFVENPFRMFEKIYYDDSLDVDEYDFSQYKNKIVKVIIKQKTNELYFDKFIEKLINQNPLELKVIENSSFDENFSCDDIEVEDTLSLLDKYVEEAKLDLDKSNVKKLLRDVYKEASEIE